MREPITINYERRKLTPTGFSEDVIDEERKVHTFRIFINLSDDTAFMATCDIDEIVIEALTEMDADVVSNVKTEAAQYVDGLLGFIRPRVIEKLNEKIEEVFGEGETNRFVEPKEPGGPN